MEARSGIRGQAWWVFGLALLLLLGTAPELERYFRNADHGYQLSFARLLVQGAVPYVDLVLHYGPLVALTSALVLWFSGSLLGETFVCALAYATTLGLIARVLGKRMGWLMGFAAPLAAFLLMARFYKWYFWIFPAAALALIHRMLPAGEEMPRPGARWWAAGGVVAGFCGLYRLDLGIVWALTFLAFAVAQAIGGASARVTLHALVATLVGFSAPLVSFALALTLLVGPHALLNYVTGTLDGSVGVVAGYSKGPPPVAGAGLLSPVAGLRLALVLLPVTYLLCVGIGGVRGFLRRQGAAEDRFMAVVGVAGLGMLPQAVYRADFQHMLQALLPMFYAGPLLARWTWRWARRSAGSLRAGAHIAVAGYLSLLLVAGLGLSKRGGSDRSPLLSNPITRFTELNRGLGPETRHPVGRVSLELRQTLGPEEPILMIGRTPQIYFFAERPMSGILNSYVRSIHDTPKWRHLNLDHVEAHPPAGIVAPREFLDPSEATTREFKDSQPELYAWILSRYTEVTYDREGWIVLERATRGGGA